jgi:hypothetical protein
MGTGAKIIALFAVAMLATCLVAAGPELGWWSRRSAAEQRADDKQRERESRRPVPAAAKTAPVVSDEEIRLTGLSAGERAAAWTADVAAATGLESLVASLKYETAASAEQRDSPAMKKARRLYEKRFSALEKIEKADREHASMQLRVDYANTLEVNLLRSGVEVSVKASGTTLRINSLGCGGVLVQGISDGSGGLPAKLGFKKIACSNGFGSTTTLEL